VLVQVWVAFLGKFLNGFDMQGGEAVVVLQEQDGDFPKDLGHGQGV